MQQPARLRQEEMGDVWGDFYIVWANSVVGRGSRCASLSIVGYV